MRWGGCLVPQAIVPAQRGDEFLHAREAEREVKARYLHRYSEDFCLSEFEMDALIRSMLSEEA